MQNDKALKFIQTTSQYILYIYKKYTPPLIFCSQATLYNHIKIYKDTGAVLALYDDVITETRLRLLPNKDLSKLSVALDIVCCAKGIEGLSISMIDNMKNG